MPARGARRGAPARRRRDAVLRRRREHVGASRTWRATSSAGRPGALPRRSETRCSTASSTCGAHARQFFHDARRVAAATRRGARPPDGSRRWRPSRDRARDVVGDARRPARRTLLLVHQQPGAGGEPVVQGAAAMNCCRSRAAPGRLREDLRFLLRASDEDYVYFLEVRGRGVFLRAAPIDVSQIVRETVLDRRTSTVLTSATLTVAGSFDYVRSRLGVGAARASCACASEFDYARQAMLYLPRRMPRSEAAGVRRRRPRARSSTILEADRGARVRAVHELRDAAAVQPIARGGARVSDPGAGHGATSLLLTRFRERRTRCCSPRPASGRAWTSSARR